MLLCAERVRWPVNPFMSSRSPGRDCSRKAHSGYKCFQRARRGYNLFQARHRAAISWVLLTALWLQAVILPVQMVRAEAAEERLGAFAFYLCTTRSADNQQKPTTPGRQHHDHEDCCLAGSCCLSPALDEASQIRWDIPIAVGAPLGYRLTDAAPRAPPHASRPYTTDLPLSPDRHSSSELTRV